MKNILTLLPKKLLALLAVFATTILLSAAAVANFGPNRPTRVWTPQENGFDHVVFNSYTGVPNGIGDERNFLQGVVSGRDANWQDPVSNVNKSDIVTAKIYIHNNADPLLNDAPGAPGVAKNVTVKIDIPTGLKDNQTVKSTISASNASPVSIFDTLDISSVNKSLFQMSYVPGSAKMAGQTLNDSIFTTGLNIGDQKGCFKYVREITFDMKIEKPGYQIQKTARLKGEDSTKWRKVVNAKPGDSIEWRISFQNTGDTRLNAVKVVDDLPTYTSVVPGSVEVYNANNRNGYKYGPNAIQKNGDQVNIDISDYMPNSNAFVYLESTIDAADAVPCGTFQIANVVYVTPAGLGTLNDNAKINVINGQCTKPIVACDTLTGFFNNGTDGKLDLGQSVKYSVGYHATDVNVTKFTFSVNGNVVQDSASTDYTFAPTASGIYALSVVLQTSQGTITSETCSDTVEVTETTTPVYSCDLFQLTKKDHNIAVSFVPVAKNGAIFKDAQVDYSADGITKQTFNTNKVTDSKVMTDYTFAKEAKNIKAVASVRFNVPENGSTTVKEVTCQGTAVLSSVTPPEIPNTGPASNMLGIFLAVAGFGAFAHRRFTLKRNR